MSDTSDWSYDPPLELRKRWKVNEALLGRAHAALPKPIKDDTRAEFESLEKVFFEHLDHNKYELALNILEVLGYLTAPRGGFWKDLIRAAENMGLSDRTGAFHKAFDEALLRLKENQVSPE